MKNNRTSIALLELAEYVRAYNGHGKAIDFQKMYHEFPSLTFTALAKFGSYINYGQAYERKNYNMLVTDGKGGEAYLTHHLYTDTPETLAYLDIIS